MKVKGTIEKRLDNMIVKNNHNIEPSVQLVAGAGCQRYLPLVTAIDIASEPQDLGALVASLERALALQATNDNRNSPSAMMGGRKNG